MEKLPGQEWWKPCEASGEPEGVGTDAGLNTYLFPNHKIHKDLSSNIQNRCYMSM